MSLEPANIRIGYGYDVHRLVVGRPLILAGVEIPYSKGLEGHSDADVIIHALTDAILGAASLSDIGTYFPDNDQKYKNAASKIFLEKAISEARSLGWKFANCDITLLAEEPKISPYVEQMKVTLAEIMQVETTQIAIKATTNERLGFVGRKEGLAATSVVLLVR